ncbi:hypothetical protein ACFOWZ_04625 [Lentzea rhizosphaerae]|uniref:V-type ATPase subunit n=1 Tax=Lentzea rhizosphaerae TaxID=2041025 RepID=A0ABV8BKV1_9PSEU
MSAAWTAGGVRARALLRRRAGAVGAREVASCASLAEAQQLLSTGPYQRHLRVGQSLEQTEHAVAATLLWHLRVLAGWQPRAGAELVRLLAGWFEVANVLEHVRSLTGESTGELYRLGTLATAWPRLAATTSLAELRDALAASPWGDPGAADPWRIACGVQLGWAARVAGGVSQASAWAAGAAALLVARARFLLGRPAPESALLGPEVPGGLAAFAGALPGEAAWALVDVQEPADLWRAEERWWTRVENDAHTLLRGPGFGPGPVVGCAALLALDARRVRAALELTAHGGRRVEVFDALA